LPTFARESSRALLPLAFQHSIKYSIHFGIVAALGAGMAARRPLMTLQEEYKTSMMKLSLYYYLRPHEPFLNRI